MESSDKKLYVSCLNFVFLSLDFIIVSIKSPLKTISKAFAYNFDLGNYWRLQRAAIGSRADSPRLDRQFTHFRSNQRSLVHYRLDCIHNNRSAGFYYNKVRMNIQLLSIIEYGWLNKYRGDMSRKTLLFSRTTFICK